MGHDPAYCLLCGTALEPFIESDHPRQRCPACGWIFYRNPIPAAGIVLVENGSILLARRAVEPRIGYWCLPSGFEEYHESPREAAVREAKEETALDVRLGDILDVAYVKDDPRKRALLIVYEVTSYEGEPQAGDDVSEVRFFALDDLPDDIAFAKHREIIENYRRRLETGGC